MTWADFLMYVGVVVIIAGAFFLAYLKGTDQL